MLGLGNLLGKLSGVFGLPSWLKSYFDNTSSADTIVDDKCVENRGKFYNNKTRESLIADRLSFIGNTSENNSNTTLLVSSLMDKTPVIFPTTDPNDTNKTIKFFVLGDSLTAYIKRRDKVIMSICAENEKISLDEVDEFDRQYFQDDSQYGDYQGDDVEIAHDLRLYINYSLIQDSDLDFPKNHPDYPPNRNPPSDSNNDFNSFYNSYPFSESLTHYGVGGSSAAQQKYIFDHNISNQDFISDNVTPILWYLDFSNEFQGSESLTIESDAAAIQNMVNNAINNVIAIVEAAIAKGMKVLYTIPPPYRLTPSSSSDSSGYGSFYNKRQAIFLGYASPCGTVNNGSGTTAGSNFDSIIDYLDDKQIQNPTHLKYVDAFAPLLTYDTSVYSSKQDAYIAGEIEIDPKYTFDDDWHPNAAAFRVVKEQVYPKLLEIINS
jgi:hypothetical protein